MKQTGKNLCFGKKKIVKIQIKRKKMMKNLIKIVAMLSFMFLFTGCNPVDEILESEKFKNLVDEKIKSEIDMQLNKFPNNEELEKLIASNISQAKEIDNLKL